MTQVLDINSRPGGNSIVPNDKYGQPSLPSTHQIGDPVVLVGVVAGVTFTEGKVHYNVDLIDGRFLTDIDSIAVKKAPLAEPTTGAA